MPKSFTLSFLYGGDPFCTLPIFILTTFANPNIIHSEDRSLIEMLSAAPDQIDQFLVNMYFDLFARTIKWETIEPYISCPIYLKNALGHSWAKNEFNDGGFSFVVQAADLPSRIYRYIPFNEERVQVLLADGKLFMPCPSMFNDPFDCSFDDKHRLTFIESAIGCFSTVRDNILMFSHYAKYLESHEF